MTAIKFAAAFAAIAALGAAGSASAIEFESNGKSVEVSYHDLDLSKKGDQRLLDARIKRAAEKVCPTSDSSAAIRKCQQVAAAHVRSSVELAIAKAQSGERYADMGKEKPVGAGN
ncbi:UrcA family protein [Sphingobium sp.]|uniref:UrcA family protein n=1 Tax=Sphingobium sp. TaxID=1912891 RepID=UPI0028BE7685|nr:UrcA family protein [Sphingobium sp.]